MAGLQKTPSLDRKRGQKSKGKFESPISQKRLKTKNEINDDVKMEVIKLDNPEEKDSILRRSKRKKFRNPNILSDEIVPPYDNKIFEQDTKRELRNSTEALSPQYIPNKVIQSLDKTFFPEEDEEILVYETDLAEKSEEKKNDEHSNKNGTQKTFLREKDFNNNEILTLSRNNLIQNPECETETSSRIISYCDNGEKETCIAKTKSWISCMENRQTDANLKPENGEKSEESTASQEIQALRNKNFKETCDNFDKIDVTEKEAVLRSQVENTDKPSKETCITETNSQISYMESDSNSDQENRQKSKEICCNFLDKIDVDEKQTAVSFEAERTENYSNETCITETNSQRSYIRSTATDANSYTEIREKYNENTEIQDFSSENFKEKCNNNFQEKIDVTEKQTVDSSEAEKTDLTEKQTADESKDENIGKSSKEKSTHDTNLDQLYISITKADEIITLLSSVKNTGENCTPNNLPLRNTIKLSKTENFKENLVTNTIESIPKENFEKVNDLANIKSISLTTWEQHFTQNLNENTLQEELNKDITNAEFKENKKETNHCSSNYLKNNDTKAGVRNLYSTNKEIITRNSAEDKLSSKITNSALDELDITEPLSISRNSINDKNYGNKEVKDKHTHYCKEEIIMPENIELKRKKLTLFYMSALEYGNTKQDDINKNIVDEKTETDNDAPYIQNSISMVKTDITDDTLYQDTVCSKNMLSNTDEQEQHIFLSSPLGKNEITFDIEEGNQTKETEKDDSIETGRKSNYTEKQVMRGIINDFSEKKDIISALKNNQIQNLNDKIQILTKEMEQKESLADIDNQKNCMEEDNIIENTDKFGTAGDVQSKSKHQQMHSDKNTTNDKQGTSNLQVNKETKNEKDRIDNSENFQCTETPFLDKIYSKKERNLTENLECGTNEFNIYESKVTKHMKEEVPPILNTSEDFDLDDDFKLTSSQIEMIELDENKETKKLQDLPDISHEHKERRKVEFEPDSTAAEIIDQLYYIRESLDSINQSINILIKKTDVNNNLL